MVKSEPRKYGFKVRHYPSVYGGGPDGQVSEQAARAELLDTHAGAWLHVVSNTYATRNKMWAAEGQERQRQSSENVQRAIQLTTAPPNRSGLSGLSLLTTQS